MPGFVDTHRHTWQTPVRGVLPSCTLDHYFAVMLGQVGGFYRPEDVHIGDYAGSLEALNAGVTTLLDWSHISNTPDHSDAAIQGLKDAGIRAVYAHGMPTGGEWWSFSDLNHPEDIRRIRDTYFSSDDGLITLAMAARQPGNSNFDVAKHDWALARELDIQISVHVGMRLHNLHYQPVKDMHDLELMGPDVCYIHMTDLTDQELDWIAETGGKASVAPYVEMLMGHGPPPIGKLLARGVRPSLSVDVVSSVPGEMFTQMRTALAYDRILAFTDTPDDRLRADAHAYATCSSSRRSTARARARSTTRSARSRPASRRTSCCCRRDAINTAPMLDPLGTIVVFSDTSNVDSVFVAGRAVKRNGSSSTSTSSRCSASSRSRGTTSSPSGELLPDWCAEPAARSSPGGAPSPPSAKGDDEMATGSVVVVGGTRGLGREVAQYYADRGPRRRRSPGASRPPRRRARRRSAARRGRSRFDLAEPHTIAERLGDVGDVQYLVLAAIERDSNTVKDYDIAAALRLVTLKLVGYTEVIHALRRASPRTPRSSSSAASRATGPIPARRRSRP